MQDIIVVEHRDMPSPDRGRRHLHDRGFRIRAVGPFRGEALPALDERMAGVVIMGGPQYVTHLDEFPYLKAEMDFAGKAMAKGLPVLGICLGAQLIARHLGASVADHPDESVAFGYYEVKPTRDGRDFLSEGLHAPAGNVQGFEVPAGATLLAEGDMFPNQAFRVDGNTYGLQFHPEVTRPILDLWQDVLATNYGRPGAQSRRQQDEGFERHDERLDGWYTSFLDRLFGTPEMP